MINQARAAHRSAPGPTGRRIGVWWVLVLALVVTPSELAGQFSAYPVRIGLGATDAGATASITVENSGASPLELRVYLSDFDRSESGDHVYPDYGEHPRTCADRLEVFPDQMTLRPGGRDEVRLRLAPGGETCWAMVFVEHRALAPSGITIAQRIGVRVLAEAPGLAREGSVVGMAPDTTTSPVALIAFENEGHGALEIRGEVEVRTLTGRVLAVVPGAPLEVLPGRRRILRVPLSDVDLEPGRYLLVGIVDFGGEYVAGGQTILEVRP